MKKANRGRCCTSAPPAVFFLQCTSFSSFRKVEDLQFRVEEESITKGDLEVLIFKMYHI